MNIGSPDNPVIPTNTFDYGNLHPTNALDKMRVENPSLDKLDDYQLVEHLYKTIKPDTDFNTFAKMYVPDFEPSTALGAATRGALNSFSLGLSEPIIAGASALAKKLPSYSDWLDEKSGFKKPIDHTNDQSLGDTYNDIRRTQQFDNADAEQNHWWAKTGGDIAGLATGAAGIGKGLIGLGAKTGLAAVGEGLNNLRAGLGTAGRVGLENAIQGAANDGINAFQRGQDVGESALHGAGMGALAPVIGAGMGKVGSFTGKGIEALGNIGEGVIKAIGSLPGAIAKGLGEHSQAFANVNRSLEGVNQVVGNVLKTNNPTNIASFLEGELQNPQNRNLILDSLETNLPDLANSVIERISNKFGKEIPEEYKKVYDIATSIIEDGNFAAHPSFNEVDVRRLLSVADDKAKKDFLVKVRDNVMETSQNDRVDYDLIKSSLMLGLRKGEKSLIERLSNFFGYDSDQVGNFISKDFPSLIEKMSPANLRKIYSDIGETIPTKSASANTIHPELGFADKLGTWSMDGKATGAVANNLGVPGIEDLVNAGSFKAWLLAKSAQSGGKALETLSTGEGIGNLLGNTADNIADKAKTIGGKIMGNDNIPIPIPNGIHGNHLLPTTPKTSFGDFLRNNIPQQAENFRVGGIQNSFANQQPNMAIPQQAYQNPNQFLNGLINPDVANILRNAYSNGNYDDELFKQVNNKGLLQSGSNYIQDALNKFQNLKMGTISMSDKVGQQVISTLGSLPKLSDDVDQYAGNSFEAAKNVLDNPQQFISKIYQYKPELAQALQDAASKGRDALKAFLFQARQNPHYRAIIEKVSSENNSQIGE